VDCFGSLLAFLLSVWSLTTYEIGRLTHPGPGYLPLALGIILILLSLILLIATVEKEDIPNQTTRFGLLPHPAGGKRLSIPSWF